VRPASPGHHPQGTIRPPHGATRLKQSKRTAAGGLTVRRHHYRAMEISRKAKKIPAQTASAPNPHTQFFDHTTRRSHRTAPGASRRKSRLGERRRPFLALLCGHGALAQLGERRLCKPEVTGSIPVRSTAD